MSRLRCCGGRASPWRAGWREPTFSAPPTSSSACSTQGLTNSNRCSCSHTTDAGRKWNEVGYFPNGVGEARVSFLNNHQGWVVVGNGEAMQQEPVTIYETTTGGGRWSVISRSNSLVGEAGIPGGTPGGPSVGGYKTGLTVVALGAECRLVANRTNRRCPISGSVDRRQALDQPGPANSLAARRWWSKLAGLFLCLKRCALGLVRRPERDDRDRGLFDSERRDDLGGTPTALGQARTG